MRGNRRLAKGERENGGKRRRKEESFGGFFIVFFLLLLQCSCTCFVRGFPESLGECSQRRERAK